MPHFWNSLEKRISDNVISDILSMGDQDSQECVPNIFQRDVSLNFVNVIFCISSILVEVHNHATHIYG